MDSIIIGAVCLVIGVCFSQRIKDWFSGVTAEMRAEANKVIADAKAKVASKV